jgi:K(+)-stimulated pyrophosphate-energized sodium pump
VEAGIPEDDPRNPATIADNVGDNVGDVAGMGADLFGSYVATILATMVLGREIRIPAADNITGHAPIVLPMVIAGLGLIFSIIATYFVRVKDDNGNVQGALNLGNWASIVMTLIASYFLVNAYLPADAMTIRGIVFTRMDVFYAIVTGLVVGALMSTITDITPLWGVGRYCRSFGSRRRGLPPTLSGACRLGWSRRYCRFWCWPPVFLHRTILLACTA